MAELVGGNGNNANNGNSEAMVDNGNNINTGDSGNSINNVQVLGFLENLYYNIET